MGLLNELYFYGMIHILVSFLQKVKSVNNDLYKVTLIES